MDPRHPEQAVTRLRELMEQYKRIEMDMSKATTSAKLGELEREGGLVIQEICLVAPRIHEAMMQLSRQRRNALAHGYTDSGFYIGKATSKENDELDKAAEETKEKYVAPNQAETVIVEPNYKKKRKTTKKKKVE